MISFIRLIGVVILFVCCLSCVAHQKQPVNTQSIDRAIQDLRSSDLTTAQNAADALLAQKDNPRAVEALVNSLGETNPLSGYISTRLPPAGKVAVPFLLKALDDPSLAYGAVSCLTYMGEPHPEATPHVIALLSTGDANVQSQSLSYLRKWGDNGNDCSDILAGLMTNPGSDVWDDAAYAAGYLKYRKDTIYNAAMKALELHATGGRRAAVIEGLARLAPLPPNIDSQLMDASQNLLDDHDRVWVFCALYIDDNSRDALLQALIRFLQPDYQVKASDPVVANVVASMTVQAVGLVGPRAQDAIPLLEAMLPTAGPHDRAQINDALKNIRSGQSKH